MAVSAVIGTVIMFAMLVSIAGSYFYFIQQDQASFQKQIADQNAQLLQVQSQEKFSVYGISQSSELAFYINNTGISISVVAYWILYQNGTVLQYQNTTTTASLPFYVGEGESSTFNATMLSPQIKIPTGGEYVIKVLSSRGTQGVGTYPSQQLTSATVNSLVAGGFGSLQMSFSTFDWYSYISGPPQSVTFGSSTTFNNLCSTSYETETNCNGGSYHLDINHPHAGALVPGGYNASLTQYTTITQRSINGGPAIDGSSDNSFTSSSGSVTLTTSKSNDVIVVEISTEDAQQYCGYHCNGNTMTVSSVTASGLTFHTRSTYQSQDQTYQDLEVWYAIAATPLSSKSISITLSGTPDDASVVAFGVSGANTVSPWDGNGALPATNTGNGGHHGSNPSVSGISTSHSLDMLIGFQANGNTNNQCGSSESTPGSGYSLILDNTACGQNSGEDASAEYQVVGSTQSGASASFGNSLNNGVTWMMIGDAIQGSSSDSTTTTTVTTSSPTATTQQSYQIPIAFSVNITNDDPSLGTIVINSASNLWVVETCDSGVTEGNCPSGNPFFVFYLMNVNPATGQVTSTAAGSFAEITIPYGVTKTLYYGAAYDLSINSFSSVGLTTAISANPFYYGQFSVFLLFSGTKIISPNVLVYGQNIPFESTTAADNFGWVSETPVTANPGVATTFSLSVNDSIFAYANPTNNVGIDKIVVNASAFSSVSATGNPPSGWTGSANSGYVTWSTSTKVDYIANGTTDVLQWQATAPSPSSSTQYLFPITVYWSNGEITSMQSALVCTVS
jgi:hypothetical protein